MKEILIENSKLIPLITFFAGYLFNSLINIFKERRELSKVRKILNHEVEINVGLLKLANGHELNSVSDASEEFNRAKLYARCSESISTKIFDSHVSHLSRLKQAEIESLLNIYSAINELKRHSVQLIEYLEIKKRDESESKKILARVAAVNRTAAVVISSGNNICLN